jgi:hypothetical protein
MMRGNRPIARAVAAIAWCLALPAPSGGAASTPADQHRFCSPDAPNVVFFIDVTTPYDDIDKRALVDGIGKVFEDLEDGARIAIRTIADTFANSAEILDACMPYCEDKGFIDSFFSADCTEGVVINEKKHLRERVVSVLSEWMEGSTELKYSEIIRTLALPGADEYRGGRENRIYSSPT